MAFRPTLEQDAFVAAVEDGKNVAGQALAGTGKTASLLLSAEAKERRLKRGIYVSFGKANRKDAQGRFPATVECHTSHSLAQDVGRYYRRRYNGRDSRRTGTQLAEAFGTKPFAPSRERTITASGVAILAKETVGRFARSADRELTTWHVPRADGVPHDALAALKRHVVPYAKAMWVDLHDPHSDRAEFSHDHYRKMWALKRPKLKVNFLMLDEAQDTDPCTFDVLTRQDCQLIAVGDANQQLYGWRGAAADTLDKWPAHERLSLTESFRFGPQIAEAANQWLTALGSDLRLIGRGPEGHVGLVDRPDAVLCRTNAGAIEQAMGALAAGMKVGMDARVIREVKSMSYAALKLKAGKAADHPALGTFATWPEVLHYVESDPTAGDLAVFVRLVEKYGAPTLLEVIGKVKDIARAKVDLVVITAHAAKGLQWPQVTTAPDFREPVLDEEGDLKPMDPAELQLSYVAVTRAERALDDTSLSWIGSYLDGKPTDAQLQTWYDRELQKAERQ